VVIFIKKYIKTKYVCLKNWCTSPKIWDQNSWRNSSKTMIATSFKFTSGFSHRKKKHLYLLIMICSFFCYFMSKAQCKRNPLKTALASNQDLIFAVEKVCVCSVNFCDTSALKLSLPQSLSLVQMGTLMRTWTQTSELSNSKIF